MAKLSKYGGIRVGIKTCLNRKGQNIRFELVARYLDVGVC